MDLVGVTSEQFTALAALAKASAFMVSKKVDWQGSRANCTLFAPLEIVNVKGVEGGEQVGVQTLKLRLVVSTITYSEDGFTMSADGSLLSSINQILGIFPKKSFIVCRICLTPTLKMNSRRAGAYCTKCGTEHYLHEPVLNELSVGGPSGAVVTATTDEEEPSVIDTDLSLPDNVTGQANCQICDKHDFTIDGEVVFCDNCEVDLFKDGLIMSSACSTCSAKMDRLRDTFVCSSCPNVMNVLEVVDLIKKRKEG